MLPKFHRALLVSEQAPKVFLRKIVERKTTDLIKNDVFIKVFYSSLNYKDALSMNGHKGVSPQYPHVPGIDAAGIVLKSKSDLWQEGDEVLVIGRGLGMTIDGGFSEIISVPIDMDYQMPKKPFFKRKYDDWHSWIYSCLWRLAFARGTRSPKKNLKRI